MTASVIGNKEAFSAWVRPCGFLKFAFGSSICNGLVDCDNAVDEEMCAGRRFPCDAGNSQSALGNCLEACL